MSLRGRGCIKGVMRDESSFFIAPVKEHRRLIIIIIITASEHLNRCKEAHRGKGGRSSVWS